MPQFKDNMGRKQDPWAFSIQTQGYVREGSGNQGRRQEDEVG